MKICDREATNVVILCSCRITYEVWYLFLGSTNFNRMFMAQKQIIRSLVGISNRTSCKDWFRNFNSTVFIYFGIVFVFINFYSFTKNNTVYAGNTRSRMNLIVLFADPILYYTQNPPGQRIFNCLSLLVKQCSNCNTFKVILKEYLIDKSFYSVQEWSVLILV